MSSNKKNITIVGAGSWGTALSILLSQNGHSVKMWSCFEAEVKMLNEKRQHVDKLPGVDIPDQVIFTSDLSYALDNAELVLIVVPSQVVRNNSKMIANYIKPGAIVVNCAKGIEEETYLRLSQVIEEEIPNAKIAVLSGPSHAEEVAIGVPTAVVAASKDMGTAELVQDVFMSPDFRVYTHNDVIGVELGGAIKNIIALCAGISDGLGFGDNTKAALMTRGIAEVTRLGIACGANPLTFMGLSGIGDLIVTCTSKHSRNRKAGILIGQGKSLDEAANEVKMVVEGIATTKAAYELSKKMNVVLPITREIYKVLFLGADPGTASKILMTRDKRTECE